MGRSTCERGVPRLPRDCVVERRAQRARVYGVELQPLCGPAVPTTRALRRAVLIVTAPCAPVQAKERRSRWRVRMASRNLSRRCADCSRHTRLPLATLAPGLADALWPCRVCSSRLIRQRSTDARGRRGIITDTAALVATRGACNGRRRRRPHRPAPWTRRPGCGANGLNGGACRRPPVRLARPAGMWTGSALRRFPVDKHQRWPRTWRRARGDLNPRCSGAGLSWVCNAKPGGRNRHAGLTSRTPRPGDGARARPRRCWSPEGSGP